MRISDWSSDVCSSDLAGHRLVDLKTRGIAFRVVHAPAHIGIDRQPEVADAKLVLFERRVGQVAEREIVVRRQPLRTTGQMPCLGHRNPLIPQIFTATTVMVRSEEHTSELQSLMRISYAVFCLKKKTTTQIRSYNMRR